MIEIIEQLVAALAKTSPLEYIAVVAGIASVWFSRRENILVYPVGLINTVIYIYLSFKYHLLGEAVVNLFYTVMSIYGWWLWARIDQRQRPVLHIEHSSLRGIGAQLLFFSLIFGASYASLTYLKQYFEGAIPLPDAFATAAAFTGMWLMARKKVESWWWWIVTNIAAIPLYFVKGLVATSFYYIVLLVMAIMGLITWSRKAVRKNDHTEAA